MAHQPAPIAILVAQDLKTLGATFRREFCISAGKGVERSKYLVVFDLKRDPKKSKSLRAFMDSEFGYVDSNAYKPAKVFRELVALNDDYTAQSNAGLGQITEEHFDKITSIKIHIESSAVLGFIEKAFEGKPELAAPEREELAKILREHKKDEDTLKLVRALKDKLKPQKSDDEDENKSETGGGEDEDGAAKVLASPLDILRIVRGRDFWEQLSEIAQADPSKAAEISDLALALSENAKTMGTVIAGLIPVQAAA